MLDISRGFISDQLGITPTTSTALTIPDNASYAIIQCETQDVRYRDGQGVPTTTVGHLLSAGETLSFLGALKNLRFIEVTSGAKLNVSYYT